MMLQTHFKQHNRVCGYIYDVTLDQGVIHHRLKLSDFHPRRQIAFRNNLCGTNIKYKNIEPHRLNVDYSYINDDLWIDIFCKYSYFIDIALSIRHCCKYFHHLTNKNQSFNNYWKKKSSPLIDEINNNKFLVKQNHVDALDIQLQEDHDHSSNVEYHKEFYNMNIPSPKNYQSSNWFGIYYQLTQFIKLNNTTLEKYTRYFDENVDIYAGHRLLLTAVKQNKYGFLMEQTEDVLQREIDYILYAGSPLLLLAVRFDLVFIFEMLLSQMDKLLTTKYFDDMHCNNKCYNYEYDFLIFKNITPLYVAIQHNSPKIIDFLLKNAKHDHRCCGNCSGVYNPHSDADDTRSSTTSASFSICKMLQTTTSITDLNGTMHHTPMELLIIAGSVAIYLRDDFDTCCSEKSTKIGNYFTSIGRKLLDHSMKCNGTSKTLSRVIHQQSQRSLVNLAMLTNIFPQSI